MTALHIITSSTAPDGAVFEAVADAMAIAGTYANAAIDFASIRDARGLAYSVRCAAAAVATAAEMIAELRPDREGGRR